MSLIGRFGLNIHEKVAVYDNYVEYRITNPTLNSANYEPIYAVRWSNPTEIAPDAPMLTGILFTMGAPKANNLVQSQVGPEPGSNNLTIVPSDSTSEMPGAEVPEPAYSLVISMLVALMLVRLSLKSKRKRSRWLRAHRRV
jgi:hypothetical protein